MRNKPPMAHVDLCSGIGGFALGFEWAELSKPVLFCDIEPWSRQILAKHWPDVPIAEDVKELANDPTRIIHAIGDRPSILTAGYPCQPFSQAGQRRGSEDDRHIWPEIFSIVQQVRPDWLVCENVSGHITMGLDEVLSDLADKANYAVQTFHLGALAVDAPHRRMRLWIVARNMGNAKHDGQFTKPVLRSDDATSDNWGQKKETPTRELKRTDRPSDAASIRRSQSQSEQSRVQEGDRARDVADANNEGIRPRIRRASSKSIKEGARRHDHDEGSRANDRFADAGKPQNLQEDVADAASARLEGAEWSEHEGYRNGLTTSSENVAYAQSVYSNGSGEHSQQGQRQEPQFRNSSSATDVAHTSSTRLQGCERLRENEKQTGTRRKGSDGAASECSDDARGKANFWLSEPPVGRVAHGIPRRVDRLKGLGNAIVPQIAMRIGQTIKATYDA